jgi:hypothetical protein
VSKREAGDDIDQSGTAIFSLLQQAVETSRAECNRANQTSHEYSLQLRAAKDLVNKGSTAALSANTAPRTLRQRRQRLVHEYSDRPQRMIAEFAPQGQRS